MNATMKIVLYLVLCAVVSAPCVADAADANSAPAPENGQVATVPPADGKLAVTGADQCLVDTADQEDRDSFWFIGTSNYHLLLHESEAQIDREIDRPFSLLMPDWKRPTTFKDWSDNCILWDIWGGYGRVLSDKFSWAIYGGGGAGTIPNDRRYYPLFIPIKMSIDFTRISLMTGTSISYYPFGRPEFREGGLAANLAATRPMTEMNIGYNHQISIADVTLRTPLLGKFAHIQDKNKYDLFWTSPRIGIETPLSETTTFNICTGYLFFHEHADEFDGFLTEFFVRHRF